MSPPRHAASSSLPRRLLWLWLCLPLLFTLTGCQGCRDWLRRQREESRAEQAKEEDLEKKKEKPKPDFEPWKVTILPGSIPLDGVESAEASLEDTAADESAFAADAEGEAAARPSAQRVAAKPGHWVQTRYRLKANNADFQGRLMAQCVDARLRPRSLERSPFSVTCTRPAALPKAQSKDS